MKAKLDQNEGGNIVVLHLHNGAGKATPITKNVYDVLTRELRINPLSMINSEMTLESLFRRVFDEGIKFGREDLGRDIKGLLGIDR